MHHRFFCVILVVSFLAVRAPMLRATEYTITAIPTGAVVPDGLPSINNAGTIAFAGSQSNGTTGIYTYSGGAVGTVLDSSSPVFSSFLNAPLINNSGLVAFTAATRSGPAAILTSSVGGPVQTIAIGSTPVAFNGGMALNDAGTVVFSGVLNGKPAILSGNGSGGSALTTVAIAGGTEGYKLFGGAVSINAAGVVAFTASTNTDSVVATHAPGQIGSTTVADTGSSSSTFANPAINNAGTVAFAGPTSGSPTFPEIFTRALGGSVTPFVISGAASGFQGLGQEVLNNNGEIVFQSTDVPLTGILFDGPNTSDQVLGQQLFGFPISALNFGADSLNDNGQIVFGYTLSNGTTGIGLATPVPEPAGLILASVSATLFARRRRTEQTGGA